MRKKSQLILHIGMEKTGSTTIQAFMRQNADRLRRMNFIYPLEFGDSSHFDLAIYTASPRYTLDLRTSEHARKMNNRTYYENFADYFQNILQKKYQCPGKTIILSNEHLSSRLKTKEDLIKLRRLLETVSANITVIVYFRPQEAFLVSLYSTAMQSGYADTFDDWIRKRRMKHLYYASLLDCWGTVFGAENIKARLFESAIRGKSFGQGALVHDFLTACAVPEFKYKNFQAVKNKSLSRENLSALRHVNGLLQKAGVEMTSRPARSIRKVISTIPLGRGILQLTQAQRQSIRRIFDEDRNRLKREYGLSL